MTERMRAQLEVSADTVPKTDWLTQDDVKFLLAAIQVIPLAIFVILTAIGVFPIAVSIVREVAAGHIGWGAIFLFLALVTLARAASWYAASLVSDATVARSAVKCSGTQKPVLQCADQVRRLSDELQS